MVVVELLELELVVTFIAPTPALRQMQIKVQITERCLFTGLRFPSPVDNNVVLQYGRYVQLTLNGTKLKKSGPIQRRTMQFLKYRPKFLPIFMSINRSQTLKKS